MDFGEIHDAPVSFKLAGVDYTVPLFRLPALIAWSAKLKREKADFATRHLVKDEKDQDGAEAKARFLTFWQPPPIDTRELVQQEVSPEGIDYVLRHCLRQADPKMPDDLIDRLVQFGDPLQLRELADRLTLASQTAAKLGNDGDDPLTGQPGASAGSPETGGSSETASSPDAAAA